MSKRLTQEEFIRRASEFHKGKYDYSKTVYNGSAEKIIIICDKHGEFEQNAAKHLRGNGCPRCNKSNKMSHEDFVSKAICVYGDAYEYGNALYKGSNKKIVITCPVHGDFKVEAASFLAGHSCPRCWIENRSLARTLTTDDFIRLARDAHGNKYNYTNSKYKGRKRGVEIECYKHGVFVQDAGNHIQGHGCPLCSQYGFDLQSSGWLYVLHIEGAPCCFTGYGITNNLESRIKQHVLNLRKSGFRITEIFSIRGHGSDIAKTEGILKQKYKRCEQARDLEGFKRESTSVLYKTFYYLHKNNLRK